MNLVILLIMALAVRAVLRLVLCHALPRLRAGIDVALRNDYAWLGTWVAIVAAVGTATVMAHSGGHLG